MAGARPRGHDGHMTTSGRLLAAQGARLRANWPAVLLPLLAADTLGLFVGPAPLWLFIGAAALAFLAPKEAARLTPFAFLAYGAYGLLLFHSLTFWSPQPVVYGFVHSGPNDNAGWAPFQAVAFLAAGVWLLAVTGAPGGAAVRRAAAQLRGTDGEPKTVPPLLLLLVIFLWEEVFSGQLWFSYGQKPHLVAIALFAAGMALVRWWPRAAAVAAVAGIVCFGIVGVLDAIHGTLVNSEYAYTSMPTLFGAAALDDGGNLKTLGLIQCIALAGIGCALAPRLLSWRGDAELAKRAQALTQRVGRLTQTRSDANEVAVAELRRIERDLHDGAQARLVAVGMSLRAAEQLMRANPEAAQALVAEARETSSRALDDLRSLVRGIYPPVLADRGLGDAVRALALDAPLTVNTDITLDEQEPPLPVAAAVYFAIAEALTNAVRHAEADTVEIGIGYCDEVLRATITDDGIGGADPSRGTGLLGVERRLATFDGIMALTSPVGGPTIVVLEVPCAPAGGPAWSGDHTWADVVRSSWQTRTLI
jgi:signal transduction histidine kinase